MRWSEGFDRAALCDELSEFLVRGVVEWWSDVREVKGERGESRVCPGGKRDHLSQLQQRVEF